MDILKQNIYYLIFQFILKIPLLTCNPKVTETSFSTRLLNHRKQFGFGATMFTMGTTTKMKLGMILRTIPYRSTFEEQCEYISKYCHRTYNTGRLCGRTLFNTYQTFESYCMMDYVNCRERYEMWQVFHMGECYVPKEVTEYIHQPYEHDYFLDTYYVVDDQIWDW